MYAHAYRSHAHVKGQSLVDYGNIKMTQHALKVSVFILLKSDTIIMEEEEEEGTGLRKGGLQRKVVSNRGGLSLEGGSTCWFQLIQNDITNINSSHHNLHFVKDGCPR